MERHMSMKTYNKENIKKILPHRGPMLLIDQITVWDNKTIEGRYYFQGEEWFFQGHFPENPVAPGVILCEIMAQAGCGLAMEEGEGKTPYLVGINNAKFRKTVHPGDEGIIMVKMMDQKGSFYFVESRLYVQEQLCAECELIFCISDNVCTV